MASGGRQYFVNAYINIRVIRETHGCHIPIEFFFPGPDSIPASAVEYMERTFINLRMVDVYSLPDMQLGSKTPDVSPKLKKGYPLKAFSVLLSSFKEVLFIDSDSFPVEDPEIAFHFPQYLDSGALFWSDMCNYATIQPKAYDVLDLARPLNLVMLRDNEPLRVRHECLSKNEPQEWETGQFVVDKARAWKGLMMTVFINWHSSFFMTKLIHGDKSTLKLGFESTFTTHALVTKNIYFQGRAATHPESGDFVFCGGGISQPHPITGMPFFIHRSCNKFMQWPALDYLAYDPIPRAWTHIAQQSPREPWMMASRGYHKGIPDQDWLPSVNAQKVCFYPRQMSEAKIKTIPKNVSLFILVITLLTLLHGALHVIPQVCE
jgi:hypothetical protein